MVSFSELLPFTVCVQVLEQKAAPIGQNTILGTDHIYVMPGAEGAKGKKGIPGLPGR